MSQSRLTTSRITKLECDPESTQVFLWDSEAPGLGVRCSNQGKKTFVFQSRVGKMSFRLTIGDVKVWTIDAAQKEARRLQILCDSGTDPRIEKKNILSEHAALKAKETSQKMKFRDAWDDFIGSHKSVWGKRHYDDHIKLSYEGGDPYKYNRGKIRIAGPIGALLDIRLVDITPEFLEQWIKKENETRATQASLAFRLVRSFMNWCEDQDEYSEFINVKAHKSRKVRRVVQPSQSKMGSLQKEQLESWFREVRALNNKTVSAYLQTVVLTGARREADASLKWEHIDFNWKSINLWDKVERRRRLMPLTPYVEQLLMGLPRVNDYVFASKRSETGYIADPRTSHMIALDKANLPHITIHDLRRTFSNMCEWMRLPEGVKKQIMGHKPQGTEEKHYTQRPLDLLRKWHTQIEEWILVEAGVIESPQQGNDIREFPFN